MKRIIVLITLLISSNSMFAQNLEVSIGVKKLDTEKSDVNFIYLDESGAPDLLVSNLKMKGSKSAFNISVDYDNYQGEQKLYPILKLAGYFGELSGGDLSIGVGYPINLGSEGKLKLHPELSMVFGFNKKDLGTLDVEAAGSIYIQVNDTKFGNYQSVDVTLQNSYLTFRPGAKLAYSINETTELRFFLGYLIGKGKSKVKFSGEDDNGDTVVDHENLGVNNMYFGVNGGQKSKSPFSARGLEMRVGIAFNL